MAHGVRAFVARTSDAGTRGGVEDIERDALPAGDVTIAVEYSSLNYKDALSATGQNKVAAVYPHVPGIDAAGTVAESTDPVWAVGDRVLVTGYDFGALRWGGWAVYARVPSAWVVRIPDALSTFEAMAIGTAGFTAALGLEALVRNGTTPESGPVVVTGATGGVGCLAVDLFAGAGYRVIAVTGKADQHDWLKTLGATEILPREAVSLANETKPRPLLPPRWAGALDNVGGATLEALVRGAQIGGNVALCGLVGGADYRGTVMPFILRGVGLLGITSSNTPMPVRQRLWQRLATDLRPRHLTDVARLVPLDALPAEIDRMLAGKAFGRVVVEVAAG
ncbi:MAG: acryloyl-CoA reductase [Vicinamibacteraceae bacterium]